MEIVQRIKKLVEAKTNGNKKEFAAIIGIVQVTFNRYVNEERGMSYEVIDAILSAFPEVSAEWLLRGKGEMIKMPSAGVVNDPSLSDIEKENIALRAENKLLRELQGLGERKGSRSAS